MHFRGVTHRGIHATHTLNTHSTRTLPTGWGGSVDESQDSGGSGNFLSPGVGQGLASSNHSAPPAPPPGPLPTAALYTKEARALGPRTLGARLRVDPRLPAPLEEGGPGSTCASLPEGRKKPARLGRGCPRAPLLRPQAMAVPPHEK